MSTQRDNSNTRLRKKLKNVNIADPIDISDIGYLLSDNFITRGSIHKNDICNSNSEDKYIDILSVNNTVK